MPAPTETLVYYLASIQSTVDEDNAISLLMGTFRVVVVPMGSQMRDDAFPGAWGVSAMARDTVPGPTRRHPMLFTHD